MISDFWIGVKWSSKSRESVLCDTVLYIIKFSRIAFLYQIPAICRSFTQTQVSDVFTLVHPYSFSSYSHKFKVPYQGTAFVIDFGRFFKDLKKLKHLTIMQLINSHPLQRWLSPEHWCCFLKYFLSRNQRVWLKNVR